MNFTISRRLEVVKEALAMGKVSTERLADLIPQAYDFDTTEYEDYNYNRLDTINNALHLLEGIIMDTIRMEAKLWKN